MVDWQGTLGAENDVIVFFLLIYPRLVLEKPATWKHQWEQEQKPTVSPKDQQRTNLEDRILINNKNCTPAKSDRKIYTLIPIRRGILGNPDFHDSLARMIPEKASRSWDCHGHLIIMIPFLPHSVHERGQF